MKRFLFFLTLLTSLSALAQNNSFFQIPTVPNELQTLQDRSDYLVEHYWDFCDLNKAFSSRDKMAEAFDTYLSFMPYASAPVVYKQVEAFLKKIKKPEHLLFIGELAEGALYSDTASMPSDELFILFTSNIVKNSKIDKAAKLRYQHLIDVLSNSQPGSKAPSFDYTELLGDKGTFTVDTTKACTVLFFNDPDCSDCNMARIRLDADIVTRKLVDNGKVDIYSIYASDPDAEWKEKAISYPENWKTVASEQVNDLYDMRVSPIFYLINPNGAIVHKTGNVNEIIAIMAQLQNAI